jgi:hypothetical protein
MSAPAFEYHTVYAKHPAHFSDLGAEGWELVGISNTELTTGNSYFYFKRRVASDISAAEPPARVPAARADEKKAARRREAG